MHLIDWYLIWRMMKLPRAALSSACARSEIAKRALQWTKTKTPSCSAGVSVRLS
jgi:hypothetical protein